MTDFDTLRDTVNTMAAKLVDSITAMEELQQGQAPEETPQFEVGQEVVVRETGLHRKIQSKRRLDPQWWLGKLWYSTDELLAFPSKPLDTDEYTVGEWVKIDREKHEGIIDCNGNALWVAEGTVDPWSGIDHGYRWPITRVPKAKFEKGQRVRTTTGDPKWGTVCGRHRQEGVWRYQIAGDNWISPWCDEAALEPTGEPDEAPRQDLPDTPPDYKGKKMQWVRDETGAVVIRRPTTREHYIYDEGYNEVLRWPLGSDDNEKGWYACEPAPVVEVSDNCPYCENGTTLLTVGHLKGLPYKCGTRPPWRSTPGKRTRQCFESEILQLRAALKTSRADAMEECAKLVCSGCRDGLPREFRGSGILSHYETDPIRDVIEYTHCKAAAIRKLKDKADE